MKKDKKERQAALPATTGSAGEKKALSISPSVATPAVPPEELEQVWDESLAKAFYELSPKQQNFIIAYIQTGNAAEAYRRAYNKLASIYTAASLGAQSVASKGIREILSKFEDQKLHDFFLAIKTLREMAEATKPQWQQDKDGQWENAGDIPDWLARKHAIDGLAKLRGLNAADQVDVNVKSTVVRYHRPDREKPDARPSDER